MTDGVKGIDDSKNHGVIASGYNPKDAPEMFVKKIISNQKRIQRTIDKYVEENNLDKDLKIIHSMPKEEGEGAPEAKVGAETSKDHIISLSNEKQQPDMPWNMPVSSPESKLKAA